MTGPTAPPDPLAPARLGPIALRNRVIKAATYEGMTANGEVSDRLIDFHRKVARGGVAMTTVAYCAVLPGGRLNAHQILMDDAAVPHLRRLIEAVHAEGAKVSAQLGHGGPNCNGKSTGHQAISAGATVNLQHLTRSRPATVRELGDVAQAHGRATQVAREAGFDAVEVHVGHHYLLSSFLSPRLNRRDDHYGGSLRNRARLTLETLERVREAAGDELAVLVKLNMDDGVKGGLWLDEAIQVAQWIDDAGSADALELTVGSSLLNPMYLFRGDVPLAEMAAIMPQPVSTGMRLVGRLKLRAYPYEPLYLLDLARQVRAAVTMPLVLLGGVNDLADMRTAMREGFEYVAMGRALLREPDLIRRLESDPDHRGLCIHCNKCMASIASGARCVLDGQAAPERVIYGRPRG